jgi:hypothetical protein
LSQENHISNITSFEEDKGRWYIIKNQEIYRDKKVVIAGGDSLD